MARYVDADALSCNISKDRAYELVHGNKTLKLSAGRNHSDFVAGYDAGMGRALAIISTFAGDDVIAARRWERRENDYVERH